ncbi:M23 family metallopeptidase [Leptolyngbya sp. AN03gr2]|uniref:M23 family metallopeptidase n=1 Tax=unclassified Leptolyngbya TaxID=2650499 RepID=UPI003D3128E6
MITLLILAQLVLPLGAIAWFAIAPPRNGLGFSLQALITAILLFAIARAGLWMFPPWWMPYAYGLLFIVVLITGLKRHPPRYRMPSSQLGWAAIVGFVAFGIFAGNEAARSWSGQFPPMIPTVDLAFPLRGSHYLILNGGNDIRINAHLKTLDESVPRFRAYRGQSYGIDIIQTDRFGLRSPGLAPSDPTVYQIYGEPVLAPCTGTIVTAIDSFPDMTIPEIDQVNRSGNYVMLRCRDADIALAHFRPRSLSVQTGVEVKTGDRIAEVGNSGASDEPHLHIHAQRPGSSAAAFSGDPLPIRLNGRYLIRGDRVTLP